MAKEKPTLESFNDLLRCAANIKTAQLAEKRRDFDKLPAFLQSGLYLYDRHVEIRKQDLPARISAGVNLRKEARNEFESGEYENALYKYEEVFL